MTEEERKIHILPNGQPEDIVAATLFTKRMIDRGLNDFPLFFYLFFSLLSFAFAMPMLCQSGDWRTDRLDRNFLLLASYRGFIRRKIYREGKESIFCVSLDITQTRVDRQQYK